MSLFCCNRSYCCRNQQQSINQINIEELDVLNFNKDDLKRGKLSPEEINSIKSEELVKLVPKEQVDLLNEEAVEKGYLSENQYKNLSNLNLIKRVPKRHLKFINKEFVKNGQISMVAIYGYQACLTSNEKAYSRIFPQEAIKICQRMNHFEQIRSMNDSNRLQEIKIFERVRCKKQDRYFNSTLETHASFTFYRDSYMQERPLAVIFKEHEESDYNGTTKDTLITNERLFFLSKHFNIEQYRVGFTEEIVEVLEGLKDDGKKVRFSGINAHGNSTVLAFGCDPLGESIFSNVVSSWSTTAKRVMKLKWKKLHSCLELRESKPVIDAYKSVLDNRSVLTIEACMSGAGDKNIAKAFASSLDDSIVFGCQDKTNPLAFMMTSAYPDNMSFSLIRKDENFSNNQKLKERIVVFQGKNRK